ncbi:hypothetical protein BDW59DRAFT_172029 [Aspergillus cavernicola]|uniref:tRNA-intron lyase n=1 Tax=Aspergillus cavernicola TaxID=176166 RepID=A0ABR4IDT6_9EURO
MASLSPQETSVSVKPQPPRRQRPDYRHIHRFPLPLSVHPLPPLIPHNPLSVISVLLSYLTYFIAPPRNDIHSAYLDSNTSSIHVTDEKTIRALWEMGFFGKGNLSRSEPTWLDQEKKRRGLLGGMTSEEVTRQRRAERRELKLQRARSEKLIIEQRLQAEAAAREGCTAPDYQSALPSSAGSVTNGTASTAEKFSVKKAREARSLETRQSAIRNSKASGKPVQFSATADGNKATLKTSEHEPAQETMIQNEEHLQLSNEEALFLVYGLGALHILDHDRRTVLPPSSLLTRFCHHSYSPPRDLSMDLKTDDPFLISYVVYHHFRSLGWVVRSGVKFGVDYLIYNRGPVFSHAEFAIVVIPTYDHPYWSETEDRKAESASKQAHSWWWLHCVNRVQAQVKKTLVVCYVEIPPPSSDLSASAGSIDIGALLAHDSIDIARLQRVALGLHLCNPVTLPHTHTNDPALTSASHDGPGKTYGAPGAGEQAHNDPGILSTNRKSPEQTTPPTTGPPATKMGSADALPSDTQVISQSVYDEIIRKNQEAGNDGLASNVDRATFMTLHEGDDGHIDLLAGFDGTNIHAPNTDENDDQCSSKLGESSPLVYEPNLFPESQRFVAKSPVTATKQRTPLVPDLESGSGVMALSQVFKATQAPSSPLVNGLQSDNMSDRPSPNIPIQHRPLAPSLSSPLNTIAATFPRDSSETQLNYVTMKESQTTRDTILKERMTRSADHIYSEDPSDGEFDKEPSFVERMRRQRRIDLEAAAQFATLSAPARQPRRSSPGAPERRDWAAESTTAVLEPHGPTELQVVGASEEETEQEEELPEPASRLQVLNSSTEEDKENCNDPPVSFSQTANAHDRLSQALSLHESPLAVSKEPVQTSAAPRLHTRSQDPDEPVDPRSSPITVVKDSQSSPGHNDAQVEQEAAESPGNRKPRRSQLQSKPTPGHKRSLSPAKQVPTHPSTHGPQLYSNQSHTAHAISRTGPDFTNPTRSSNPSREGSSAGMIRFSNSAASNGMEIGDKPPMFDQGKPSSMPSRVAETPMHQRQRSTNELLPLATIPETSPNCMNNETWMSDINDAADQEDDDLPPLYPGTFERANQSQPVVSDSSSPIKHLLNSKILSSPSGRQRRALTEIAADASPQVGGTFDLNINIMSADDHEFRSAVAMSPIPPRKKRRGNDGRNIPASDPIVPVTPRQIRHLPLEREIVTAQPPRPLEPASRRQSTFPGRSKPRRAESFWDTEDSPKFRVSSKERSKIFAHSLAREPRIPQPGPETPQVVAAQSPRQTPTPIPEVQTPEVSISEVPSEVPSSGPVEESPASNYHPPANALIAPNQVLAPWRGQKRAYYPATCFGKPFGTSQDQYLVKFEDSALVEVPTGTVKRLELRIGDAVKVDMPNVPKVSHIIKGFADKLSADDLSREAANGVIPVTDVYGHSTLILGPKQRKSLPSGGLAVAENFINVPISRVYLDTIVWNQLKDRFFTYSSGSSESRLQTPSDRHSTPTSPSTRFSRSFRLSKGLFSGMVFAVSYGDKSDAKYRITKMILENDGRILEDGFNELFEAPLNAPLVTPSKSPAPRPMGANINLRLKPGVEEVGFACLIADKHSRRPKYMQALALNLPCLSDRWIEDCVAKGQVLDWEIYLLPAGESSYLNGATKSRVLTPYLATKARLSETVAARPNLLHGQSVLLITGRNGKADEERRKAYIFLTYALGASKIERVPDIQSARDVLNESQTEETSSWDWIYIDDDDKTAGSFGTGSLSKKRRKSKLLEPVNGDGLGLDSNVRIVGNEFVCQSLILGRLVE